MSPGFRGAGHRLGQHAALEIEDPGGDVAALAHDRTEGGSDQGLALFFHDGQ
jgi:hypothetical protein